MPLVFTMKNLNKNHHKNMTFDVIIESPGRINLIGEHIDYNGGHVLPAAINKKITLKFKINGSTLCNVYSSTFNSGFELNLNHIEKSDTTWQNYVLGVVYHINKVKPDKVKGFNCIIESDLPLGSGVSSSAALECGIAKGLNELFELGLSDLQLITISRDAEHSFVGTKCGIMDQFAVVKGKKSHLLLLNCDTLDHELIKVDFAPYTILLLNTNISHKLVNSEYNVRRNECQKALKEIQMKYPEVKNLADIQPKVTREFKKVLPQKIYSRALFVSKENRRTLRAVKFLKNNRLKKFGKCLYKSHQGLKNKYEVSCKELDFLVDFTSNLDYVLGARMMGGGFGGCTINIVHQDHVQDFIKSSSKVYKKQFNIELTPIEITIGDGVLRKHI